MPDSTIERAVGYYWMRNLERPSVFVARWDGSHWTFIGSVFLIEDDQEDEYGERIMARYEVLDRIDEPARRTALAEKG
ncbi:MAG TPA: hypothetical protein VKQ27_17850 [Acetobacteraceae bacterium]|nr:hypothetical protein [Acetobacteraceae bacterium]